MAATTNKALTDLTIPRRKIKDNKASISGPSYASFTSSFGNAFKEPLLTESDLGTTAIYDFPPPSGKAKSQVLVVHGLGTPALGMLPLAQELQKLNPDAHIVLYDLWGHGFSSTPLTAHAPHIFHLQIFQVLGHMKWPRAHIIGYSFGGLTAVSFATTNPTVPLSVALVAPAGILDKISFSSELQDAIDGSPSEELEAVKPVFAFLEGGELVVPPGSQEKMKSGIVVAQALRHWQNLEHHGHPYSALSIFRDGGVFGQDERFRTFAGLQLPTTAVVGENDDVCKKPQLDALDFAKVEMVSGADHTLVRSRVSEVARFIHDFWMEST